MNPVSYLKDTITELKLVHWPSREETLRLTVIVVIISLVVAVFIGALDFLFSNLLTILVK